MEQNNNNLSKKNEHAADYLPLATVANTTPQSTTDIYDVARTQQYGNTWYKLDNAAQLYALTSNTTSNAVFAISVVMKETVNPLLLQHAVNDIYVRFPTIVGAVKQGVFWQYIGAPSIPLVVMPQSKTLCSPITTDGYESQVRITYYGNRVNVEFFHTATDGTGAITFVNSLIARYLVLSGKEISHYVNCKQCDTVVTQEETTDMFAHIATHCAKPPRSQKAMRLKGNKLPYGNFLTYRVTCNSHQLRQCAKDKGATVTELLSACALLAINKHATTYKCKNKHPIRVLVPVNLRSRRKLDTMRNFASYTFVQYNNQRQLDEVIADVKQQLRTTLSDDSYFDSMVSANVRTQRNALLRLAPLSVKKAAVSCAVAHIGDGIINCGTLSNLGMINTPCEFEQYVQRYDFTLGKGKDTINFAVVTFNDVTTVAVTSQYCQPIAAREFFTLLASTGIDVAVEADITEKTL